ncbi:MAG: hypothetical protein M1358_00280 [Chloroflexi bacterium]|nr:hypothetical protein [Chloroflexota bacterium]
MPIEAYKQWKRARAQFFDRLSAVSEQANLTLREADKLAKEAVRRVRRDSHGGLK